jgi:cation:H+ antiporter
LLRATAALCDIARRRRCMRFLDFRTFPLWANLAVFAVSAAFVWVAGTRLAKYADAIGARTGLSRAFLGLLLLGVATSLPEVATTITAAMLGNARLVAGNLFGGVSMQIAVLAIVDIIAVRGALTFFTPQPLLLFQGVMLLLLLTLALAGAILQEPLSIAAVGLTPVALLAGYVFTVWISKSDRYLPRWRALNEPPQRDRSATHATGSLDGVSSGTVYAYCAVSGAVILAAGWALAQAGDAVAEQTNLGASFVGVALVAGSTSLPELSTTLAAVRQGNYQMAVSNILGTNCLEVALFFLADLLYREGPILAATDRSALFAGVLGLAVTCIYLLGLLERRDRTFMRMGLDSVGVLIAYTTGLVALYFIR